MALEESPGVVEFETRMATREARVKYDPGQISEEQLIQNIKKRTRYSYVRTKQ